MRTYAVVATAEPAQAIAASSKPLPITLTAHLKKAGEVMSSEGWVGLPGTDDFIESFAVDWAEKPVGVDLLYTCMVAGSGLPQCLHRHFCRRSCSRPAAAVRRF